MSIPIPNECIFLYVYFTVYKSVYTYGVYIYIYDGVWQTSWNPCFLTQLLQVFHGELLRVVLVKPPGVKPRTMGSSTAEPATNQLEESREMNIMWINKIYSTHLSRVYTTYLWYIIVLTTKCRNSPLFRYISIPRPLGFSENRVYTLW